MKKILIYSLFLLLLSSCFTMKGTRFHVATTASEVSINSTIKQIRILNRTRVEGKKLIEVINTGSITYVDPPGLKEAIKGFSDEIDYLKFYDYRGVTVNRMKRPEGNGFPDSLSFLEIKEQYSDDYLLSSLEFYNTFESISYVNETKMQLDTNGNEYYINIVRGINTISGKSGWRLYNSVTGEVHDESWIQDEITITVEGINKDNAREKLNANIPITYAQLGKNMGIKYAQRISPMKTFVGRNYHSKSKKCEAFKRAIPFVKADEWEAARIIWEEGIANEQSSKDMAKLYFNLGVFYERAGNLEMAISQLEKSYLHNEKIAKGYLSILKSVRQNGYPINN